MAILGISGVLVGYFCLISFATYRVCVPSCPCPCPCASGVLSQREPSIFFTKDRPSRTHVWADG